jgi:hypothetical protein
MKRSQNLEKSLEENLEKINDLGEQELTTQESVNPDGELIAEEPVEASDELTPVAEVFKELGVSRQTGYKRMEYLKIKPWKKGNRAFLDGVQVGYMNDLNSYVQDRGSFEGFPVPEPTGPWEPTQGATEAVTEPVASSLVVQEQAAVVESHRASSPASLTPLEISEDTQNTIEQLVEQSHLNRAAEDLEEVDEQAQYRAAGRLIAGETLTLLYESTGEFTVGNLKKTVEEHRQRCNAARRGGSPAVKDFLNQKLMSLAKTGKSGSTT